VKQLRIRLNTAKNGAATRCVSLETSQPVYEVVPENWTGS
jgi:hypothetical protein